MTVTEALALLRQEVDDKAQPYLVPDETMYLYLDDAQKMFSRWTEGIEDGRSFSFTVVPGTEWYDLDRAILKLRKAYDVSTGRELRLVNTEKAEGEGIVFDGRLGPLRALVAGIEKHALRAWPTPNVPTTVRLETFRLPREVCAGDEFEIDEQHHQHLLMWAKHRFYNNQDSEVNNPRRAAEFEQRFRMYCADARKEQVRARRNTGAVMYGGI